MQAPESLVICAAGVGSRLGLDLPKCLVQIEGKPLIHHVLSATRACKDVRVVVGFRETDVIAAVRDVRPDALIVRNPNYRDTTNVDSLFLGSRGVRGRFIGLDGDVLINEVEFKRFLDLASLEENLIAITPRRTDDAVSVEFDEEHGLVRSFRLPGREGDSFEWAGLASIERVDPSLPGFFFRQLEPHLPTPAVIVECYEIDTDGDLAQARRAARDFMAG